MFFLAGLRFTFSCRRCLCPCRGVGMKLEGGMCKVEVEDGEKLEGWRVSDVLGLITSEAATEGRRLVSLVKVEEGTMEGDEEDSYKC